MESGTPGRGRDEVDRWRRVSAILDALFELPGAERRAYLDRTCEREPDLRREVEAYLEADRRAGPFLDRPAGAGAVDLFDALARLAGDAGEATAGARGGVRGRSQKRCRQLTSTERAGRR